MSGTAKRAKRIRETPEFASFTRRIMRALSRRIADGDVDALGELEALRAEVDRAMIAAVVGLRSEPFNYSWAQIGDRLGVTRQAAQIRFGKHMPEGIGRAVGGQPASLR